ncbi:MAG: hypothetical protein UX51_C0047G0009 [Candidatus Azambacteria bacterium GW2011_GWF2_46_32]|uniref:Uncharacterized protein n=2 Tax=Candidatus Azamiibacteriota TaxID=1752741 RepID=A0A0G1Q5I8_9BACT|nr:MAG: hypothetical protein UX51_C0047G0009 [Candidatus Azambacteria bacterium GW2011_GWF2_46_32]KKU40087.1 MAG: hypothetical protein UX55_C0015G0019 [Candidatus Azambacteria bacterium GW2011_GWE2_46_45]
MLQIDSWQLIKGIFWAWTQVWYIWVFAAFIIAVRILFDWILPVLMKRWRKKRKKIH